MSKIEKLLSTYIPTFENSVKAEDGWNYVFGSYNLGGTVSYRLSSSDPNMQNQPSSGKLGKLIKSCFEAPEGYIFCGIDYNGLEDRISALTTKDPNKLKVYTDKYDGHSLRAYSYWPELMPDIDPNSVESINSIQDKYPDLRGKSKNPSFALTYQGTYSTLMRNCGFSEPEARKLEANFGELYKHSIEWVNAKLKQVQRWIYNLCVYLRVRTPVLHQVISGTRKLLQRPELKAEQQVSIRPLVLSHPRSPQRQWRVLNSV